MQKQEILKLFFLFPSILLGTSIFIFLILIFNSQVKAVVNPDSIRAQVEQTVEARRVGPTSPRLRGTGKAEIKIIYSWLDEKILIRKINGQWYLSLSSKS